MKLVLDLPQIYTKPSLQALMDALDLLELKPPSWGAKDENRTRCVQDDPQAIAAYLTKFVSNSLKWLDNDNDREAVWELASRRLSERSGRTGTCFQKNVARNLVLVGKGEKQIEI